MADVVAARDLAHRLAVLITAARLALSSRVAIPTSHGGRQAADHVGPDAPNRRLRRAAGVDDLDLDVIADGKPPGLDPAPEFGGPGGRLWVCLGIALGARIPWHHRHHGPLRPPDDRGLDRR